MENGKVTGSVTRSDILSGLNYNVVICSEEMDIEVPGKILYVTTDAVVTGKKTATSISEEREKAAESRRRQHRKVRAQTADQNSMAMRRKASLK